MRAAAAGGARRAGRTGRGSGRGARAPATRAWPALQDAVGQQHAARRPGPRGRRGPQFRGELLQPAAVLVGAHVDEGDDHVPLAREARVQGLDGVEDRVAGGELVVDEDQRAVPGEQRRVLGQQQMGGGVQCASSKPPTCATPATGRRVECRYGAAPDRRRREWPSPVAVSAYPRTTERAAASSPSSSRTRRQAEAGPWTAAGRCGTCLPSTFDTSRWARLGLRRRASPSSSGSSSPPLSETPSRSATHSPVHTIVRHLALRCRARTVRTRAPAVPDRRLGRHRARRGGAGGSLTRRGSRSAGPRSRRPPVPRRRPPPAAGCAPPRRGAASPRSSCSCRRSAALRRRPARAAGCPGRR